MVNIDVNPTHVTIMLISVYRLKKQRTPENETSDLKTMRLKNSEAFEKYGSRLRYLQHRVYGIPIGGILSVGIFHKTPPLNATSMHRNHPSKILPCKSHFILVKNLHRPPLSIKKKRKKKNIRMHARTEKKWKIISRPDVRFSA